MSKLGDGNTSDVRLRPDAPAVETPSNCGAGSGTQTDLGGSYVARPVVPSPGNLFDWTDTTDICPKGMTQQAMDRLVFKILANHFSDPTKIQDPSLTDFIYNPDLSLGTLRIVMNTAFDLASSRMAPALIIKRGEQKSQRVVIGDLADTADDVNAVGVDGLRRFMRLVAGQHSVVVTSRADGEIEALANEVWLLFHTVGPMIPFVLPIYTFEPVSMSELSFLSEGGALKAVAIGVSYSYEYSVSIDPGNPVVSSIGGGYSTTTGA